jgi:hypothetical protein
MEEMSVRSGRERREGKEKKERACVTEAWASGRASVRTSGRYISLYLIC